MTYKKGFTLVELLVVVAILGVLAAVGIVAYNGYIEKSKINTVKTNVDNAIKYIETELMKCELGLELETKEKFELAKSKGIQSNISHSPIGCSNWRDRTGSYVSEIAKFGTISESIIMELEGQSGRDMGFKNPFYPELDLDNSWWTWVPSGIQSYGGNKDFQCPTGYYPPGTILCGFVNDYDGTDKDDFYRGKVSCCARLKDSDNKSSYDRNPEDVYFKSIEDPYQ